MLRLAVVRTLVVCVALCVVVLPWTARADTDAGSPASGRLPLARASEAVRPWATVVWAPTRILAGPGNDYEYMPAASSIAWLGCGESCRLRST